MSNSIDKLNKELIVRGLENYIIYRNNRVKIEIRFYNLENKVNVFLKVNIFKVYFYNHIRIVEFLIN